MEFKLRYPNITGTNEREQIEQIKRYLFQLVDEIQFAGNGAQPTSGAIPSSQRRVSSPSSSDTNAREVFAVLKPLIIKSADIVNAYYEKLSTKFEGAYVAQSDFGTYTERTAQVIEENSTSIGQAFTNIQTIDTDLQGVFTDVQAVDDKLSKEVSGIKQSAENTTKALSKSINDTEKELSESIDGVNTELGKQIKAVAQKVDSILTVNAYIKSGLLYYNDAELPVYGVEVGQTNNVNGEDVFKKFARFTADRLSFYDQNNKEVAYISDYKLYITSVEILYNLIGGGFILDLSRGWTLKFAGGE